MNATKMLILLLILFSAAVSIEAPTIIYPTNNYINRSDYYVNWTSVAGASCYTLNESFNDGPSIALPAILNDNYTYLSDKSDGKYTYIIQAGPDCYTWEDNFSAPAFIIIDTHPPSVSSKSPGGVNEDLSSNVTISFDEVMNTSSFSISSGSSNISFGSPVWSNSDQTVTIPYTATNEGETFVISFKASDLAGNWMTDSMQFTTLVKPTTVTITSPKPTDEVIQGDSITFTASVAGVDSKPVTGATVTVSGGCSTTLTESSTGVYTGSCEVSGYGDGMNFTVSALNGGQEANSTVSLDVAKNIGLTISVVSPTSFEATRGDSIPIKVRVTADDVAVDNAVVSAPSVTFTHTSNGEYVGTLQTTYSSPQVYGLSITAEATVQNQHKTTTKTITFALNPVSINPNLVFLENDEETSVIHSGKTIKVKLTPTYPDGSPAEVSITGTLTPVRNAQEQQPINLTFTKQGDSYVSQGVLVASDYDSSYSVALTLADSYGNSGVVEQSILGPAKGLKFVPELDELVFAPGQKAVIKGKVRDELNERYLTDAVIEFNGKTYTYDKDGYYVEFDVSPNASTGTKTLNFLIKTSSMEYPYPLTVTITKSLKVIVPDEVEKNKYTPIQILYPDGSPVTEGNFSVIVDGRVVPVQKGDDGWFVELDLGTEEGPASISLSGSDEFGNKLNEEAEVSYKIGEVEKVKQNAPLIFAGLIGLLLVSFIVSYFYSYAKAKSSTVLTKEQVIEKYKHLLFEKEKANYLKTIIAYSVMTGQIRKEDQPLYEQNLLQTKQDLDLLLSELELEHAFLKEKKTEYVKEAVEKLEKMKPVIKQNLTDELKETKALNFIKQKLNYGLSEEDVRKRVVEQFGKAGEAAIVKAEAMNLFKKKEQEVEKKVEELEEEHGKGFGVSEKNDEELVELVVKLLGHLPEFRIKQALVDEGIEPSEADAIIQKAKARKNIK